MSDSDQLSGGSSLSLFSGLGTSSISGTSETGYINVEELSESKLESALEEQKIGLRLLILESIMFESYFDRLVSGQISMTPTSNIGSGSPPRKGSGTLSDSVSNDSDSLPPTSGTSLLDVSHRSGAGGPGGIRPKRSNSKTSLGSRGKSLRLSNEQKCGIGAKEMERISRDLELFRKTVRAEVSDGMALILEHTYRLQELSKAKRQLSKAIAGSKIRKNKQYNYEKLENCFNNEISSQEKYLGKLQTKNGVLQSQIKHLMNRIRLDKLSSQETGPIDLEQLQLENATICKTLENLDREVIEQRKGMVDTRRQKNKFRNLTEEQEQKRLKLEKEKERIQDQVQELFQSIPELEAKIGEKKGEIEKLKETQNKFVPPSTDDYIQLKLMEEEMLKTKRIQERKDHLAALTQKVGIQKERRKRSQSARAFRGARNLLEQSTSSCSTRNISSDYSEGTRTSEYSGRRVTPGRLIRGKTFNLEFRAYGI